jgi:hypothetical protein
MNNQQHEIDDLKQRLAKLEGAEKAPFVPAPQPTFDPLDKVFSEQGIRGGLPEWQRDAVAAVPDALVRGIVQDNTRAAPAVPKAVPVARGTGWQDQRPLSQPYVRECDAIAESFAQKDRRGV